MTALALRGLSEAFQSGFRGILTSISWNFIGVSLGSKEEVFLGAFHEKSEGFNGFLKVSEGSNAFKGVSESS